MNVKDHILLTIMRGDAEAMIFSGIRGVIFFIKGAKIYLNSPNFSNPLTV